MKKYYFSTWLTPQKPVSEKIWIQLLYEMVNKENFVRVNDLLVPSELDISNILRKIPDIKAFDIQEVRMSNGIFYIRIKMVIHGESYVSKNPGDFASTVLLTYRNYFRSVKNLFPSPFITDLNDYQMLIGVPVSKEGMQTLATLQAEYRKGLDEELLEQSKKEQRLAKALRMKKDEKQ